MNNQEIFDKIVKGILTQGGASFSCSIFAPKSDGICKYRSAYGRKCAIGWLIPEESYNHTIEDLGSIRNNHYVKQILFDQNIDLFFAEKLQKIHDLTFKSYPNDEDFIKIWSEKMKRLAADLGLSMKVFHDI